MGGPDWLTGYWETVVNTGTVKTVVNTATGTVKTVVSTATGTVRAG